MRCGASDGRPDRCEIVVADNGSTDDTRAVVEAAAAVGLAGPVPVRRRAGQVVTRQCGAAVDGGERWRSSTTTCPARARAGPSICRRPSPNRGPFHGGTDSSDWEALRPRGCLHASTRPAIPDKRTAPRPIAVGDRPAGHADWREHGGPVIGGCPAWRLASRPGETRRVLQDG